MTTTKSINLNSRPKEKAKLTNFDFSNAEVAELQEGEV
jgi:NADPH-dependent curcumin reductase CurA